jgi:hypothetical protein
MSDGRSLRPHRVRELVFALCTAWLMLQNVILFVLIAWQPLTGVRIATLVLLRVAVRAAAPASVFTGTGLFDVACSLLATGTGVHHA